MGFLCGLEGCSRELADSDKGLCSGCKGIHYCSKEHQREDWKNHKTKCKGKEKKGPTTGIGSGAKPSFHLEYKEAYPADHGGFSKLATWFQNFQMMAWNMQNMVPGFKDCLLNSFGTVDRILSKRWGLSVRVDREILAFLQKEGNTVGQVWRDHPALKRSIPFGTGVRADGATIQMAKMQNMRNTPSTKLQLERGKTYISLGFVDLQQLMEADLVGQLESGPVSWHGYDMNPAAVAKSELVLAMLKENVPVEHILQIWYSTSISLEAARTLQVFCEKLMLEKLNPYFFWWASQTVRVEASIQAWERGRADAGFTSIPALLSKMDRLEYARYILKGQIFIAAGAENLTGNPTFTLPKGVSCIPASNESIYCTMENAGDLDSGRSLFASIERRFVDNLANLRRRVKENQIKITLSEATISADSKEVLKKIKSLNPAGIEWSNLPDYFNIPDFFSTARQCSVEGTKHSFHLMNWVNKVYGANLVDYVPFRENYMYRNFDLGGFFKDKGRVLPTLTKRLSEELEARLQKATLSGILRDPGDVVSLFNIMDLSTAVFSFRFYDTYMNFMFENTQIAQKKWKKADLALFDNANTRIEVSFEF